MEGDRCNRNGCTGLIEDGFCNSCGIAPPQNYHQQSATIAPQNYHQQSATIAPHSTPSTGTGSSPLTNRSKGSRRVGTSTPHSSRKLIGGGLVSVPELPSTDPEKAIISDPKVPENKRFCTNCNNQLKREVGFCSQCGQKFSFVPTLRPGDLVVGQYEVKGAIAYGGLGWIYLGFDRMLSRYVVLKGLLNTEDASSAAVAVAERQFLAAVKHPNIVGIYNFVNHGSEGFIVMEYVGGKTLKEIRKSRGPLPVDEAIAYIHRVLSAFDYLHSLGLVYCDFKPDNVMLEGNEMKLIDLGGVRRIDDLYGDIYGSVGYSAPEAGSGPTVVSDLFTIGRTLAVLLTDIRGFNREHLYTLPSPQIEPLFAQQESLYRFLLKATATAADDRFQSAAEMADQLWGVLREVVALSTDIPRPEASKVFSSDMLALTNSGDFAPITADYHQLPNVLPDTNDPAFIALINPSTINDPLKRCKTLKIVCQQFPTSSEAWLRLANSLIDTGKYEDVEKALANVEMQDAWDWRTLWYRGRLLFAQGKAKEAQAAFDQVYFDLPGELAPKLALGLAAEQGQNYPLAIKMYELVCRTDPSYVSAAFGLARCLCKIGNRSGAVVALKRVPQTSNLYTRSQVEIARTLIDRVHSVPGTEELKSASAAIEALTLESTEHHQLTKQILETALNLLISQQLKASSSLKICGQSLEEVSVRQGLEKALRQLAHLSTGDEKISLIDQANQVRSRTLV